MTNDTITGANLSISDYLLRIGYTGPVEPTLSVLKELVLRHTQSIAFENIDVLNGLPISLKIEDLETKIINKKRGGYCFELNTLFAELLNLFGFNFKRTGARVIYEADASAIRPRTHKILIVQLEDKEWLVDVTFGAFGINAPIELNNKAPLQSAEKATSVIASNNEELLRVKANHDWINLYQFNRNEMLMIDYEVANFYTSQYPDSIFRKTLIAHICSHNSAHIIRGDKYTVIQQGNETSLNIRSAKQLQKILINDFDMKLSLDDLSFSV